ncbi:MAG TPA: CDP-alcohol phosphatidyltransferase family protein [Stellaceae bacterium]|nr:CDP-alcohol phosphatidyltransferase family protein [Stellaceae bacterium]
MSTTTTSAEPRHSSPRMRELPVAAATKSREPLKAPSSHSNSYVRRFMRAAMRPFAATGLTPNGITWARIVTGVGACLACAAESTAWDHAAALLWLVSALLDRADGEFARMTKQCSESGRLLDYRGDVVINALIFFALGFHLRHGALGEWALLLGGIAFVAVAMAGILAEALELRIGQKTVPSRHGFDLDDILFVLVPILWLGYCAPLLFGAALGGSAAVLYLWRRLSRLSRPVEQRA